MPKRDQGRDRTGRNYESESEESDPGEARRNIKSTVSIKGQPSASRRPPPDHPGSSDSDSRSPPRRPKKSKSPQQVAKHKSPKGKPSRSRSRSPKHSPSERKEKRRDKDRQDRYHSPQGNDKRSNETRITKKRTNQDSNDKGSDLREDGGKGKVEERGQERHKSRERPAPRDDSQHRKESDVPRSESPRRDRGSPRRGMDKERRMREHDRSDRSRDRTSRRARDHRDSPKDRDRKRSRSGERGSSDRKKGKNRDEESKGNAEERPSRKRKAGEEEDGKAAADAPAPKADADDAFLKTKRKKNQEDDILLTRTGGAYIPPARLRMMQQEITDKSSVQFQRLAWEALKKSINGLINKVNISNIRNIICELFQENIVRGRGLLCRSIMQAQAASPTFTHVYAALVAIINTKFPQIGELLLKRLALQFKKGYRRNDKTMCLSSVRFVAHLVNQQVAHEILALEVLTLLLENPTDDSVEVALGFLQECGSKLTEVSPRGIMAIFERLRHVGYDPDLDKRVHYMIDVISATRKDGFKSHPSIVEGLDLVEEEDQFTHMLTLEDAANSEDLLNVFRNDPQYLENEEKYQVLKKEILGEGSSDEESGQGSSGSDSGSDSSDSEEEAAEKQMVIDNTETNLVALRRIIYLTIQSSLDFEECTHKLLKTDIKPGQENEICSMIMDCCAQQRTYEKFFGLLAQRFCMLKREYQGPFQQLFIDQYETCHRLETNKLRNVAKFFAHLLHSDAMSWEVLQCIKLNEDDTTSSSRIFIKILFQELCEYMSLKKLNDRLKDETLQIFYDGLLPRDNPKNTRFAINFFTSIGLGGLTDDLRAHLKTRTKALMQQQQEAEQAEDSDSSDSDSSSSSSSSDSSDSSSESDSSSDSSSDDSTKKSKGKKKKMSKAELRKQKEKEAKKKEVTKAKKKTGRKSSELDTSSELHKKEVRKSPEPRKLSAIEERMKALAMPDLIPIEPHTLEPMMISRKKKKNKKQMRRSSSSAEEVQETRTVQRTPNPSRAADMREEIASLERKLEDKKRSLEQTNRKPKKGNEKERGKGKFVDNDREDRQNENPRGRHDSSDEEVHVKKYIKHEPQIKKEDVQSPRKPVVKSRERSNERRRQDSRNRRHLTSESDQEPAPRRKRQSESDYDDRPRGRKSEPEAPPPRRKEPPRRPVPRSDYSDSEEDRSRERSKKVIPRKRYGSESDSDPPPRKGRERRMDRSFEEAPRKQDKNRPSRENVAKNKDRDRRREHSPDRRRR